MRVGEAWRALQAIHLSCGDVELDVETPWWGGPLRQVYVDITSDGQRIAVVSSVEPPCR